VQKRLNRSRCRLGHRLEWVQGSCIRWDTHWRHLANTIEPSVCGGYAALCQFTLTTCYVMAYSLLNAADIDDDNDNDGGGVMHLPQCTSYKRYLLIAAGMQKPKATLLSSIIIPQPHTVFSDSVTLIEQKLSSCWDCRPCSHRTINTPHPHPQ